MHSTSTLPASCTPQTHAHNKTCHLIFIQQLVCVCVKGRDQQGSGPMGWHLSDSCGGSILGLSDEVHSPLGSSLPTSRTQLAPPPQPPSTEPSGPLLPGLGPSHLLVSLPGMLSAANSHTPFRSPTKCHFLKGLSLTF